MHFYSLNDGEVQPRHFVPMSTRPGDRPTRITDVKKWWRNGELVVPSVTTVLNVLDKGGLTNWKIDQHLIQAQEMALEHESSFKTTEEWIAEAKRRTEIEMDKAPSAGTDLHKKLELMVAGEMPPSDPDSGICAKVLMEVENRTGLNPSAANSEQHFVSDGGFGGCVDLHWPTWLIDYKTKREASKFKPGKMAYDDHSMQGAAYRRGLGIPKARVANVFICLETGEIDFHEHSEEQLQKGWDLFKHALAIWKIKNGWHEFNQKESA